MELLANIVNGFQPSTIFAKTSPFDFLQGFWIYPYFKYKFFPINVQWPFQWLLPFSDLSHTVVIVKRIQNPFFVLPAMTELIVRVMVSSNTIRRVARSNKHSWNWTVRSLKLWDLNKRQIRSSHRKGKETPTQVFFCEIGERPATHRCFPVKLVTFLRNSFRRTSANDCFWQMISGMAYPVLYNIKDISQIFVSLVHRWCIFWFYKIANMHSFRVQL